VRAKTKGKAGNMAFHQRRLRLRERMVRQYNQQFMECATLGCAAVLQSIMHGRSDARISCAAGKACVSFVCFVVRAAREFIKLRLLKWTCALFAKGKHLTQR